MVQFMIDLQNPSETVHAQQSVNDVTHAKVALNEIPSSEIGHVLVARVLQEEQERVYIIFVTVKR